MGNTTWPLLELNSHATMYACDFAPTAVDLVRRHPAYACGRLTAFVADITGGRGGLRGLGMRGWMCGLPCSMLLPAAVPGTSAVDTPSASPLPLRSRRPDGARAGWQRGRLHHDFRAVCNCAGGHAAHAAPRGRHAAPRRPAAVQVGAAGGGPAHDTAHDSVRCLQAAGKERRAAEGCLPPWESCRDYAAGDLAQDRLAAAGRQQRLAPNFFVRWDGTCAYYFSEARAWCLKLGRRAPTAAKERRRCVRSKFTRSCDGGQPVRGTEPLHAPTATSAGGPAGAV